MNADEIMKQIESLDNGERLKLLDMLYDKFFDNRPSREVIERLKNLDAWGEEDVI